MFKHTIRWLLPIVVIALVVVCLALTPVLATHAAAPAVHHAVIHHMSGVQGAAKESAGSNWYRRP